MAKATEAEAGARARFTAAASRALERQLVGPHSLHWDPVTGAMTRVTDAEVRKQPVVLIPLRHAHGRKSGEPVLFFTDPAPGVQSSGRAWDRLGLQNVVSAQPNGFTLPDD